MQERWKPGPGTAADLLDQMIWLSNRVGEETALVQPGGGNVSVKVEQDNLFGERETVLMVKGSGSDLRHIDREGFSRLSLRRLQVLRDADDMTDEALVSLLTACMLHPGTDPVPSLETPLHAVLPYPVVLHTHDVASLSLTNLNDGDARRLVGEVWGNRALYVPYARPGFPLARAFMDVAGALPEEAKAAVLAHHGLIVWGDNPRACYEHLLELVDTAEEQITARTAGRQVFGPVASSTPDSDERRRQAIRLLPVLRGLLGGDRHPVLHLDGSDRVVEVLAREGFAEVAARGVATPDHILWAGPRPVQLDLDLNASDDALAAQAGAQIRERHEDYLAYHARHAGDADEPLADWARVALVRGIGLVGVGDDADQAAAAATAYRATLDALGHAEALGGFTPSAEADVWEFERWPLERRKIEAQRRADCRLLSGHVALVVGGASGIGKAAAERLVEEGAHVVLSDLDTDGARRVASEIATRFPGRAVGLGVDVRDESSLQAAVEEAVLSFGGLDVLFYTAGRAPTFARIVDLSREAIEAQLEVHYVGALLAVRAAARVMRRQGRGGAVISSVSKAALAPGKEAAAYGGSKAALLHALRIAALELGEDNIRVNAINADQIDTPLFRRFVAARAEAAGRTVEEQLDSYRGRNALGRSLIPARDVADLVVLLASRHFAHTTGDILTIDGGLPDAFPR